MPDLRTVLTETQRAEIRDAISAHRLWNGRCEACGAVSRRESDHMADVVIETLAGLPGVAVTQLPEPADLATINHDYERDVAGWDVDGGEGRIEVRVDIFRRITLEGTEYSAQEIRALVPVLLAAAALSVEGNTNA